MTKREFLCTQQRHTLHYCVFRAPDGTLNATSGDAGDVRFHPATLTGVVLAFAENQFEHKEQLIPLPHLNLDVVELTDEDACVLVELPAYFLDGLDGLTRFASTLDLQRPSHIKLAKSCADLATAWMELGLGAARMEAEMRRVISNVVPPAPVCSEWFETSWGEGPFTLGEVERMVSSDPGAAHRFHNENNETFAQFRGIAPDLRPTVAVRASAPGLRQRTASFASLASIVFSVLSFFLPSGRTGS